MTACDSLAPSSIVSASSKRGSLRAYTLAVDYQMRRRMGKQRRTIRAGMKEEDRDRRLYSNHNEKRFQISTSLWRPAGLRQTWRIGRSSPEKVLYLLRDNFKELMVLPNCASQDRNQSQTGVKSDQFQVRLVSSFCQILHFYIIPYI